LNYPNVSKNTNFQQKKSYANVTSPSKQTNPAALMNIAREMLKIKETFPNLPNKKIEEMQKVINSSNEKVKLKINMTIQKASHHFYKQQYCERIYQEIKQTHSQYQLCTQNN